MYQYGISIMKAPAYETDDMKLARPLFQATIVASARGWQSDDQRHIHGDAIPAPPSLCLLFLWALSEQAWCPVIPDINVLCGDDTVCILHRLGMNDGGGIRRHEHP